MSKAKGEIKRWQGLPAQDKWIFPWELTQFFCLNRYWLGEISSFLFPASTAQPLGPSSTNSLQKKDNKLVLQGRGRGPEVLFISQHSHQWNEDNDTLTQMPCGVTSKPLLPYQREEAPRSITYSNYCKLAIHSSQGVIAIVTMWLPSRRPSDLPLLGFFSVWSHRYYCFKPSPLIKCGKIRMLAGLTATACFLSL